MTKNSNHHTIRQEMANNLNHNNKMKNIIKMKKTIRLATQMKKDSLENIIIINSMLKIIHKNKIPQNQAKNNMKNKDTLNSMNRQKIKKIKILGEEEKIKILKPMKSLSKKLFRLYYNQKKTSIIKKMKSFHVIQSKIGSITSEKSILKNQLLKQKKSQYYDKS